MLQSSSWCTGHCCVLSGKTAPGSGLPTWESTQGRAYRGLVSFMKGYTASAANLLSSARQVSKKLWICMPQYKMNKCRNDALPKTALKFYDGLLFPYKILSGTLSDIRKSVATKLISRRFTSPAHLGANKTQHRVWLLSFEFSSVITELLPKVLSVLVLPQWIPMVSGKCRAAAK